MYISEGKMSVLFFFLLLWAFGLDCLKEDDRMENLIKDDRTPQNKNK